MAIRPNPAVRLLPSEELQQLGVLLYRRFLHHDAICGLARVLNWESQHSFRG